MKGKGLRVVAVVLVWPSPSRIADITETAVWRGDVTHVLTFNVTHELMN